MTYIASEEQMAWHRDFIEKGYHWVLYIEEPIKSDGFIIHDIFEDDAFGGKIKRKSERWGCFSFMSGKLLYLSSKHDYEFVKENHKTWKPVIITDNNIIPITDGFPEELVIPFYGINRE